MKAGRWVFAALWLAALVVGGAGVIGRLTDGHRLVGYSNYVPWGLWVAAYIHFIGRSAVVVDGKVVRGESKRARGVLPNPVMLVDRYLKDVSVTDPIGGGDTAFSCTPVVLVKVAAAESNFVVAAR